MLVERASVSVETKVVLSHEGLTRGALRGVNPFTKKLASSKQVKRCSVLVWNSCRLNGRHHAVCVRVLDDPHLRSKEIESCSVLG